MISRKAFWSVALALAVVGAASGAVLGTVLDQPTASAHASWKDVFEAPSQLSRSVDSIVVAKAVAVQPGRTAFSSDGKDKLQYDVYQFEVVRGVKGAAQGETLLVERASGFANGERIVLDADGGNFEIGASYLLFLNKQDDGPYHFQVNNQGRYLIHENKLWSVDPTDSVSAFFEAKPVSEGLGLIRGYLRESRAN